MAKKIKNISIISFTKQGFELAHRIRERFEDEYRILPYTTKMELVFEYEHCLWTKKSLHDWCEDAFGSEDAIIFIGAAGIAVRTIAPFLKHKSVDPAVLVIDELGIHVISLLSGHLGGANELATIIAKGLGADPVITTASDVNQHTAVDVWAQKNDLHITDMKLAKRIAARILAGENIHIQLDVELGGELPPEFVLFDPQKAEKPKPDILVSSRIPDDPGILHLVPKEVILGIGCRSGKPFEGIWSRVQEVLSGYGLHEKSIYCIASINLKDDEPGLLELAKRLQVPFKTFSAGALNRVPGTFSSSEFVKSTTGTDNVCERAAIAALPAKLQAEGRFICRKDGKDGVTLALVDLPVRESEI